MQSTHVPCCPPDMLVALQGCSAGSKKCRTSCSQRAYTGQACGRLVVPADHEAVAGHVAAQSATLMQKQPALQHERLGALHWTVMAQPCFKLIPVQAAAGGGADAAGEGGGAVEPRLPGHAPGAATPPVIVRRHA